MIAHNCQHNWCNPCLDIHTVIAKMCMVSYSVPLSMLDKIGTIMLTDTNILERKWQGQLKTYYQ